MRLDLRLSDRPLENLWCQAIVATVFKGPYLTEGALSGLDGKMSGYLTSLEKNGFWTATRGEAILVTSQNKIRADKILLKGLGKSSDFEIQLLADCMTEVGSMLDKIEVREFGIYLSPVEVLEAEFPSHLELSVCHMVDPFQKKYNSDPDFILKIIFSIEERFMTILDPIKGRLREYFSSLLDFSIIIDSHRQR